MKKFAIVVSMLLAIAGFGKTVPPRVVVIVNKNNNNIVDKRLIAKIYNGEAKGWGSGGGNCPFCALLLKVYRKL